MDLVSYVQEDMGEVKDNEAYEEELLDYEEEDEKATDSVASKAAGESAKKCVFFFSFLTPVFPWETWVMFGWWESCV